MTSTETEVAGLPAESVAVARSSWRPDSALASQKPSYGATLSVAMRLKAPPPAGRPSNVTEATPDPRSEASEPRCTFGPPTTAPVGGSLMETEGTVLSTRAVRSGLVPPKPPASVATARKS